MSFSDEITKYAPAIMKALKADKMLDDPGLYISALRLSVVAVEHMRNWTPPEIVVIDEAQLKRAAKIFKAAGVIEKKKEIIPALQVFTVWARSWHHNTCECGKDEDVLDMLMSIGGILLVKGCVDGLAEIFDAAHV